MTVSALPFKAVLLACDNGHYEATTQSDFWGAPGVKTKCSRYRCGLKLRLVKTVTIRPGGRR